VRSICDQHPVYGPAEREVIFTEFEAGVRVTDHRVAPALPAHGKQRCIAYIHGRMKFPVTIPEQDKGLADHLHDF
jgi:hypothetical protein